MRRIISGIAVALVGLVVLPAFAVDKDDKDKKDAAAPAAPDVKKADDAKKDDATKADAKKDDPKKDDPKKDDPKKDDPKKDVKKDDAKKDDPKKDDAKKDDKKDAPKTEEASSEKLIVVQTLIGKLVEVNETKKSVRIQTNIPIKKGENLKVEVVGTDGLQIRQANPPIAYDDKGRPRKRTHKELKELKGDSKLPGYPGRIHRSAYRSGREGHDR